ncbi:stevor [Plasmodium sp. gorilla clade G1]|nr:stevor [Plasmodium sp. gorilla clade G1]
MKMYYLKMLLFNFLINTLVLPHYENYLNSHYNISLIPNNTQRTTIKSRLLAEIQKPHNPHYHNDPELKEIINKLNEEAIKNTNKHMIHIVVEKNGTKHVRGNAEEPMSTIEKDLLVAYVEMFGDENRVMLKSDMYPNDDDKSSTCECSDTNNTKLATTKGKDKYLKHLKHRCIGGICSCSVGSAFLTILGLAFAKKAALTAFSGSMTKCASFLNITNMFNSTTLLAAIKAGAASLKASTATLQEGVVCLAGAADTAGNAVGYATTAISSFSIAIYVLIAIIVLLIILYIWLYIRRKNSWKHECKKHLCK